MKYTKYLINGKFIDVDSLQSDNFLLQFPLAILGIIISIIGICIITGLIPMAVSLDEIRGLKYQIILIKRKRVIPKLIEELNSYFTYNNFKHELYYVIKYIK